MCLSMDDCLAPYAIFGDTMESGLNPVGRTIAYHTATGNDLQSPKIEPGKEKRPDKIGVTAPIRLPSFPYDLWAS